MDPKHLVPGEKYIDEGRQCRLYFVGIMPLRRDGVQMYAFQRHSNTAQQSLTEEHVINHIVPAAVQNIKDPSLEQPIKRSKTMDQNIAAILRDDTTTVDVASPNGTLYIYVTNLQIKVGDLVVVPFGAENRLIVLPVAAVHDELRIEPNSETQYKWVIQVVDMTEHNINLEKNALIEKTMASTYQKTARAAFRQSALQCASDEDRAKLEAILSSQPRLGA